jgi:galactonate dehydratase
MDSCQFSLHARNALIQESVRAFYAGWYQELVTTLPKIEQDEVTLDFSAPGLFGARSRNKAVARFP